MKVEETTIALWRFDETDASGKYIDETKAKRKLSVDANVTPIASANSSKEDHFGEESVGFKWQEGDSADGRWNDAEVGPFLASTVTTPAGVVAKGLSIKDGKNTVLFDTERCMVRAAWSDGFLKFDSTRHGLISSPTIGGRLAFAIAPASVRQMPRFRSIQKTPTEVIVEYAMGKVIVRESFRAEMDKESLCVQRHIRQIGNESVTLPIASAGAGESIEMITPREAELRRADGSRLAFSCRGGNFHLDEKNLVWKSEVGEGSGSVDYGPRHLWMERWFKGTREPPDVVTRVKRSTLASGLVVDDLPLPVKNPFRSLCFASGHDFFSNGDVAVSMVHGDVWIATGVNEELQELRWRRFATGLFQPLGVKIVDDVVYVIGRDQITRLVDEDKDGEADLYECVTNQYETSPGGHDYVACLETDSAGRFHFVHATMGLVRVDPATRRCDPIATGFRNPNGLAIGPGDVITVSPQEGTWTPTSAIAQIKTGAYYGFPSERDAKLDRPVEPPLCWIPRLMDNSSGGQVWAMGKHLGPLNGQLLHTTFGQCRLMLVVRDRDGRQGGVVPLPLEFRSGLMRGRVSPRDGHLYVSGLKGWVSAAVDDGCLCRVRCAGGPVGLPIAMKTTRQGLDLTFTEPIDRSIAEDPDRYVVERWNYRRTSAYGSAEYSVADPLRVGRDPVDVPSATLLADERTVHLEIPDLAPVMQISVACDLVTKEGFAFQRTLSATIHEVSSREVDYPLARRVRPGQLPEEVVKRLQTGLVASLVQGDRRDWLVTRQLAMTVPTSTSATHGVGPEPFTCQWNGFLQVPMAGEYRFGIEGTGQATLFVNDRQVKEERVQLHRGYNRIRAQWLSSSGGEQRLRVLWRSERFAEEPIPATSLCHDSKNDELAQAEKVRRGEQVWRERQCGACHDGEPTLSSPALVGLGSRFTNDWLARWLIDPSSVRPGHEMPLMFSKDNNHDRQMVADLMSFLMKEDGGSLPASEWTDEDVRAGSLRYEQLACLACHHFEDNGPSDEYGRISLASVGSKFRAGKLAEFLKRPSEHHPSTRMPDFSLTDADAKSLAAYVASRGKKQAHEELLVGDPDRGLNVFLVKGCGNCHKLGIGSTERHPVKSITSVKEVDHGCLRRVRVDSSIPWFEMTDADRSAVSAYLESVRYKARATEGEKLLVEETRYLVDRYRCFACHSRDGKTSPRGLLLQEESESGLPVETLPDLTWAGEKLRMGWVRSLLSGKEKPSRPWLTARMPTFPNAEALSAGLAAEHGLSLDEEESIAVDPALAKLGRELVGLKTGLDCRQCHAMGSEEPIGDDRTQIALGINFATVRDRMRHEHYGRFVLDPPRFDIGTRMPRLVTDGRSTRVTSILGGDASKQFEAIWHYIHSLPRKNIAGTR
jgi:mono/diheme cytochrome c family protein